MSQRCEETASTEAKEERLGKGFVIGLGVGLSVQGLLNPIDRALYLMVLNRRPFISRANFTRPWDGLGQSVVTRTLSGGLFFPLFDLWHSVVVNLLWHPSGRPAAQLAQPLAGNLTGVTMAILLNPLNAVKYEIWGKHDKNMHVIVRNMWRRRGVAAFTNGMHAAVARDAVFGGVYSCRGQLQRTFGSRDPSASQKLAVDLITASLATALSSPLNYARNMQFGCLEGQVPPRIAQSLRRLWIEVKAKRLDSGRLKASSYLQQRLGLGWGTLRVGLGMTLGQQMYDFFMSATK